MSSFPLRLPKDLKEWASGQAEAAGVSLNQYIATALAARVGAQAEAERALAARGARAKPGHARGSLARAGRRRERIEQHGRASRDDGEGRHLGLPVRALAPRRMRLAPQPEPLGHVADLDRHGRRA